MATGIITLATLLLGILFWWLKRADSKANDPLEQNRKRYEQIDKQITSRNSNALTVGGGADLDELERLQRAHGGQRGSERDRGAIE